MARLTVAKLLERVEALEKRVEALEKPRKRIGFEYEGCVGGEIVAQHLDDLDVGDRRRRG